VVQRKHNRYRTTFVGLEFTILQQTIVTRFGEGQKPPAVMGSMVFYFAITPCCLVFQCELLRVGVMQRNLLHFCKVKIQKCGEQIFQWRSDVLSILDQEAVYIPPQISRHIKRQYGRRWERRLITAQAVTSVKAAVETRRIPSEFAADITGWERKDIQQSNLLVSWLNWSDVAHDYCGWYMEHNCTSNDERFGLYCVIIHSIIFK
jgi:hypothetical protein